MRRLVLFLSLSLLVFSCDDMIQDPPITNLQVRQLVKKIKYSNGDCVDFSYNAFNQIEEVSFFVDGSNEPVKEHLFEYINGGLSKITETIYQENNTLLIYETYYVGLTSGFIAEKYEKRSGMLLPIVKKEYQYTPHKNIDNVRLLAVDEFDQFSIETAYYEFEWNGSNYEKITEYGYDDGNQVVKKVLEFTYDNKNNFYSELSFYVFFEEGSLFNYYPTICNNNPLSLKITEGSDVLNRSYTYVYNGNEYPVSYTVNGETSEVIEEISEILYY